ncbi:hypothetical protein AB0L40_04860 [Patulibacter sp. NPDC049589]|uniref:hypothetical protein n=1 Tax=Patulibacter sp. NPDC049589 TaxID=3154731 RepID=UPI00343845EB
MLRDAQELAVAIAGPAVRAVVARRAADRTVWLCDTGRQRPALMLEAFTTQVTPIGPASEQVLAVAGYRPGDQATVTVILDGDDRIVTGHLRAEVWLTLVSTHDLLSGAWRIRGATPDGATTFDDPFLVGGRRVTA